jgi:PAS domain S-box-containing protein
MSSKTTRVASLLEAVPDALVGMDQEGVIRFVNRQTESLFGYDRDQLIGRPIERLVPESLWQIYAQHRENYFTDPRTRSSGLDVELIGRHQDGTEFPINISLSNIDTGDVLLVITAVHDVNQRHEAVKTAQLLEAIVEYSDDAIVGSTLGGIITSWNPAATRMYGYSSKEIIGRSGSLLIPEDRAGEMDAIRAKITAGQHLRHFETERVRKDGTVFPVSLSIAPICDEDGAIIGVSGVHRDVTEQRQAFEAAQRMASIVKYSDDAIISRGLHDAITSWNPAAERILGYSSEEIIGKSASLLIPEDRAGEIEDIVAKVRAGQHVEHLETTRLRQDGTVVPVSLTVSPIRDENGALIGASTIARDVTEQRQAFEAAQRMAAIVETSEDAIISGTLEGIITSWNPAAERMFGYSSKEIIGKSASLLTPEDRVSVMNSMLAEIKASQHIEHLETTLARKDRTVVPVSLTTSPIRDAAGVVVGASMICRDVTEQRQASVVATRLARIVEGSEDAIISGSLDGLITSWNPAAERMYGYSSAEVIGKPATLLSPRDRAGEVKAVLEKIKAGRHVERLETKRVRKGGAVFPVSLTVSPIRDTDGTVVGSSVIHRDLTEQKGALAVAQRMAAIVEYSDDAIIGRTLDGIITSWNPAAARMFGYSSGEIVGEPIDLLVPQDRTGEIISILAKISAGRAVDNFETIRARKDGTVFPVSLTVSPIRDERGKVVGASMIYRDVSELKHAAQYARSLIEASMDPLETISPEGKITDVNEAAVKATGVPRHKLIGTEFSGYFTDPDKARQGYQRVFAQGSVTDYPLTLRHRNGTLTDVLCNASVYRDTNGNVLGVFAAARDMTKQKEAYEAAQRMAAIVEYSDDAIIGSTLEGIITSWNPAAERMYGHTSEQIAGRSVDLLSPKDRTGEIKAILAKISKGRPVENFETICFRKDRTTFPVKLTVAPIRGAGGAVVGAFAIARELT